MDNLVGIVLKICIKSNIDLQKNKEYSKYPSLTYIEFFFK